MASLPDDLSAPLDEPHFVSASDFIRQFGTWRERAVRAPIYIHHRGRPRLVLTSVAIMEALCGRPAGADAQAVELAAVWDGMRELAVVVDHAGQLVQLNRAARRHFAVEQVRGLPLGELFAGAAGVFLAATARRVAASGTAEAIEVESPRYPGRRLAIEVVPHPAGVLLLALDVTDQEAARHARALLAAIDAAADRVPDLAITRVGPRGILDDAAPALARLIGVAAEGLAHIRFVTLLEPASRVILGEAFDAVMADGEPRACDVRLLVNRGEPRRARIGLAPIRRATAIEGVLAVVHAEAGARLPTA